MISGIFNTNSGFRKYIDYFNVTNHEMEFSKSFFWQLNLDRLPEAIYWPSEEVFHVRLQSVEVPQLPRIPQLLEQKLHNFNVVDYGLPDNDYTFTLKFFDFIDNICNYTFSQMAYRICNPITNIGVMRNQMLVTGTLYKLDSRSNPILHYSFFDGLFTNYTPNRQFNDEMSIDNDFTVEIKAGMAYMEYDNIRTA